MTESTNSAATSRPPCRHDDALAVLLRLREAGHVAYFAGGCVRDMLLGIEPKDWDVATDAHPPAVRKLFPRTQAVGAKFGVILVREGKSVVEVATFRTDGSYDDGRHPTEVKFTTAEEDAKRRDFTINGLFLDPADSNRIIDFVGGQEDLENKLLRAIGEPNHRFEEDHLRLLRAVRFATRFDLTIEPATATAIEQHVAKLPRISPERIAEELRLVLVSAKRTAAFRMLLRFGILDVLMRLLAHSPSSRAKPSPGIFESVEGTSISFGLALAASALDFLVRDAGPENVLPLLDRSHVLLIRRAMRQSLRISNVDADTLSGSLSFAPLLETDIGVAKLKRFLAEPASHDARVMMSAVARAGMLASSINSVESRLKQLEKTEFAPPPLLTGDDLVAAGYQPGPAFKRVLDDVYDAQLEDRISTKEEAMQVAMNLLR